MATRENEKTASNRRRARRPRTKTGHRITNQHYTIYDQKRKTEAHKRDDRKRKSSVDTHRTRTQRAERKPDGEDDTESDTNMDEQQTQADTAARAAAPSPDLRPDSAHSCDSKSQYSPVHL